MPWEERKMPNRFGAFYCNLMGGCRNRRSLGSRAGGESRESFPGGWRIQKDPAAVATPFVCIAQNCSAAFLFPLKTVSSLARVQRVSCSTACNGPSLLMLC